MHFVGRGVQLLNADRGDAIVPTVVHSRNAHVAEVGDISGGLTALAAEVAVDPEGDAGTSKDTDGGDVVVHAEGLAVFATAQADVVATEVAVLIEAGSAAAPVATVPVAAGRPGVAGTRVVPAVVALIGVFAARWGRATGIATRG